MSVGSFKKLKNKYLLAAAVKAAVLGVSAGLAAVGATLLPLKLCAISIHFAFYILIGFCTAAAVFLLFFFLFKPNDNKLAKKLDTGYNLNERVQTMLEYSGRSGEMIELQRDDAAQRLSELPKEKLTFKKIWYFVLVAVLALALFFTAVFIPAKKNGTQDGPDEPINPDPIIDTDTPWEYDVYFQAAMTELYWNIKESTLADNEKEAALSIWTALDTKLRTVTTEKEMQTTVYSAIDDFDNLLNGANTFRAIHGALTASEELSISSAIMKAVATYLTSGLKFTEMTHVVSVESLLNGYIEASLAADLQTLLPSFKLSQDNGLKEFLDGYTAKITTALQSSGVEEDEATYAALAGFAVQLSAVSANVNNGFGNTTLHGNIDTAFGALKGNLMAALKPQSYRIMLDKFLRNKLGEIFGLPVGGLPSENDDLADYVTGGGGGDVENPGDGSGGGGYGSGDEQYGSNDLIYDPVTGTYVKFGDILTAYEDRLAEDTTGAPPDLKTFIEEYFNILHNGFKDESSQEK